jgi:hypothetical protein
VIDYRVAGANRSPVATWDEVGWRVDLTPKRYECSTHSKDLTAVVVDRLEEQGVVAYGPKGLRRKGGKPFKVVVTCTGDVPGTAHPVTCTGTRG